MLFEVIVCIIIKTSLNKNKRKFVLKPSFLIFRRKVKINPENNFIEDILFFIFLLTADIDHD